MKNALTGYLTTLYNQNPQAVGGSLPSDGFYYVAA
jgi:NitT/TauT family transport system substrate-binding protein